MSASFTHLHVHTQYSLLDGAIRISALPAALKERGLDACAITDHGNLFGAVEFYTTLRKAGLRPIIGMGAYVARGNRHERNYDRPGANATHLTLLCQNDAGYRNLIKLASLGYTEGKHYGKPRIDRELLEQYHEGLIALSAYRGGILQQPIEQGVPAQAHEAAQWLGQVFDGRFYVELQQHGLPQEAAWNAALIALAEAQGLPLVATNDCHYLEPEEGYAQYVLQLMGRQRKVTDANVEPFVDRGLYLKTAEEMAAGWRGLPPEALSNTARIAEQCEVHLDGGKFYLPNYETPEGYDEAAWFDKETRDGLRWRLGQLAERYGIEPDRREQWEKPYWERLDFELGVITQMRYAGYFLIVAEFINWAKQNHVRVGPGRGSGAGSLVAYALRITDLDPLYHGLLFERFLNPERVSLPDFDVDFDVEGRDRVIQHVREKYGENRVCQIATFGSLKAKAAVRGVARVLDFPYSEADKIAKLIPNLLDITLERAIEMEPELARLEREGTENERKLIQLGRALEGLNSNLSTHAAGVIIMDTDVVDVLPICTATTGEMGIQSQYSMKWAEHQGAVKFDFLGLLNLTIIEKALSLIDAGRAPGERLDLDNIPLDDQATFDLLSRGDTTGVFQLESGGIRRLLMELRPSAFGDVVAVLALYRPGPLNSGMTEDYVRRKNGQAQVFYPHPALQPVLGETYGVMAYQEQVMEAARLMAGYSLGQADLLRRAMGKKLEEAMAEQRDPFVQGCLANGISEAQAEEVFTQIHKFSGYGFNKSHSAAYGLIAYQTAYLKAHHPVEFMAALLSSDMDNTDKVVNFIADCREMGVQVLPPDINHSGHDFTIDGRAVRFGLDAVKNVGRNAVAVILAARKQQTGGRFADLKNFVTSVDLHRVNRRVLEALIKCGAFDSLEPDRARLLGGLDNLVALGLGYQNSQVAGQESLFSMLDAAESAKVEVVVELPQVRPFSPRQQLSLEKEALGFYISGHPLDRFASELSGLTTSSHAIREGEFADGAPVLIAGVAAQVTVRMNKSAEKFAIVRLEDLRGSLEVAVYTKEYAVARELLQQDQPLLIHGKVRLQEEGNSVRAERVTSLSDYRAEQARGLTIPLDGSPGEDVLRRLTGSLAKSPGQCQVALAVRTARGHHVLVDTGVAITPTDDIMEELEALLPGTAFSFGYPKEGAPVEPARAGAARSPGMAPPPLPPASSMPPESYMNDPGYLDEDGAR